MSCEIVAEIGASHGQDLERAKTLCVQAIQAGADSVKLQTYLPDTISYPGAGLCPSGPWRNRPLYDLYREAHMPRAMQAELIAWLKAQGIAWFSTPFSPEDVAWLEEHGCERYKLSSFDAQNEPLIQALIYTRKHIVASDGMSRGHPGWLSRFDVVLRCVSDYPAYATSYGLGDKPIADSWGISDHTTNPTLGVIAIAKGAVMIERHVKLDGDDTTPDAAFATPITQFRNCVHEWREAESIANSTVHTVPLLKQIMPRPVTINGQTVWRRCVQ